MRQKIFLLFVLLCAAAQGAWAQKALYEATAGDVGKVVCNNGHLHPAKTAVTGLNENIGSGNGDARSRSFDGFDDWDE